MSHHRIQCHFVKKKKTLNEPGASLQQLVATGIEEFDRRIRMGRISNANAALRWTTLESVLTLRRACGPLCAVMRLALQRTLFDPTCIRTGLLGVISFRSLPLCHTALPLLALMSVAPAPSEMTQVAVESGQVRPFLCVALASLWSRVAPRTDNLHNSRPSVAALARVRTSRSCKTKSETCRAKWATWTPIRPER